MLERLTSTQITEWEAFDSLDPIGSWRDDYRMAYIACTIVNTSIRTNGKKGAKLTEPKDYMPEWDYTNPDNKFKGHQSMEDMKSVLLSIANSSNKKQKKLHQNPPKKDKK